MNDAMRDYFTAADTEIGRMIEGYYGWHEWCPSCANRHLMRDSVFGANHRSIDVSEAAGSWRDYTCYGCGAVLWKRPEPKQLPAPKEPFPTPGPRIVKGEYSM